MENISVMPPQTHPPPPQLPFPPPCLIQSINTSSFSLLVSHCISSLASTRATRHNRPGSGFPQTAKGFKVNNCFFDFYWPKDSTPPLSVCPNATRPHISLRGINYSKEGDCAGVWKWCCLADCTCNSFNKVFKKSSVQHLRASAKVLRRVREGEFFF